MTGRLRAQGLLLAVVVAAASPAVSAQPAMAGQTPQKVLRLAFPVAETGFDPAKIVDLYSRTVTPHIFEALYQYDHLARPVKIKPLTAVAMPEALSQAREDMQQVVTRLARANVGQVTLGIEEDIVTALEEMLEAVRQAMEDAERKRAEEANKREEDKRKKEVGADVLLKEKDEALKTTAARLEALEKRERERVDAAFENLPEELREAIAPLKDALPVDQIAHYLEQAPLIEGFIKDLQQLPHGLLEEGQKVPAWKLVNKRATRQWTNEDKAVAFLTGVGVEAWGEPKPLSPAQAEKALKKAKIELPADLVVAVSTGSTLVPENDPRPAVLQIGQTLTKAMSKIQ